MPAKNHIDLVVKTLAVMESLAASEHGKALKEISADVSLVKSSVFRILYTLKEAGYVEQTDASGIYRLTLKTGGLVRRNIDRLRMTELAIDGERGFGLTELDAPDPGGRPNYTLATLERLRSLHPNAQLFCLMGADSFLNLHHWRGAAEIPFAASLVVASRPGQNLDDLAGLLPQGLTLCAAEDTDPASSTPPQLPASGAPGPLRVRRFCIRNQAGQEGAFYLLPDLDIPISATEVRQQLIPNQAALPPAVLAYIREKGLYAATHLAHASGERLG